jgi:D-alanyl-D-alanine carboxypeptidase/D-alanyl-D-alanine-endopeptidase (penicillin-binding protein 4)
MRRLGFLWVFSVLSVAGLRAQTCARLVAAAEALGARTGVAVCDSDGRLLYGHRVGEAFAPASNMKLLAATAVLDGLGIDHRFTTRFRLRGGRLVVEASGDPNWIHGTANAPERVFADVAAALRRRGITTLAGIDLDPGSFVGLRPPGWPQDQLYTYYCAPTGPFVLEQGTFVLGIAAAADATAVQVELVTPPAGLPIEGCITVADRSKGAVYGALDLGSAVQVRGKFYRKSPPVQIRTAVVDPATWYLASLRQVLQAAGVAIDGAPANSAADLVVHEHRSELRPAIERMLEDSSNWDAEQCLRVLGDHVRKDGSLAGGLLVMRQQLAARLGSVPDGVTICDGSGLSRDNRVTPGLLAAALIATSSGPAGAVLRECLPNAGRSGTLSDRFVGSDLVGRVRAKTGWIRGASALSGMVERADGTRRWFSILMNYDPKQNGLNKDLKALQEQLVAAIDAMAAER